MKSLLPGIAVLGVAAAAAPSRLHAQQQCDSIAVVRTLGSPLTGRHQVLAPRDSANLPSARRARLVARRVRMADGTVRIRKYVTKGGSGVPVTKQKPPVCAPVPKTPGTSVGDVGPTPTTPVPGIPTTAPGEVIPPVLPVVGSRFPLPLLGGLLLGGTAIAVGSHTPGSTTTTAAPPGGGTTTPPGGGTTTPPGGGTTPPGGGTTPPGGGTTPPGGGTTPPGGGTPPPSTPVPEPSTVVLLGGALLVAGAVARRKR